MQALTLQEVLHRLNPIGAGAVLGASTVLHVQTAGNSTSGDFLVTVNLNPTTAGNLLVVGVNSTNGLPTSVTDNKSDSFVAATSIVNAGGGGTAIYYAKNITSSATTVTVNTPYGQTDAIVSEYSGLDLASPLDQSQKFDNGYKTGLTFTSGSTATTSQGGELLWGFAGNGIVGAPPVWAAGAGWTGRKSQEGSFAEDQIAPSVGQFAATGSFSSTDYQIFALIATFKPSIGVNLQVAPAISSFTGSPASVSPGGSSTLSWSVSGNPAPVLSISGIGSVSGDSITVNPTTTTTYTLTASNTNGNVTAQTTVTVIPLAGATPKGPVLFFSDLNWGPKTGWEGSATKGAAVTIWGKNFGASRGASYVTVNGANLTADTDYAEWGAQGPARGLERITFWLNSGARDGGGNISITVNGTSSNQLPFTVAPGTIYFISVTDGNNASDGLYSTARGAGKGPFKDVCMFNPGVASQDGVTTCHNPSGDGQYIAYVRGGTYTATESSANPVAYVNLRGPYGGPTKQKALIGYPGETPVFSNSGASGIVWEANYAPYGANSYFTFAKLMSIGSSVAYTEPFPIIWGSYNRIIGNSLKNYLGYDQAGLIGVFNAQYTNIYGNLMDNSGNDSMKHYVYIKTQGMGGYGATINHNTWYTDVGWNEMSNAAASDKGGGVIFVSHEGTATVLNYTTDYVYIHDNFFHGGNMEFFYEGDGTPLGMIGKNIYLYNNIFKGGASNNGAATIYDGADTVNFYNNTFYQTNGALQTGMFTQTGNTRTVLKNNIWYAKSGLPFFYLETYKGATQNSDHDLFFNGAPPSGPGLTVTSPKTGDPLFTAPASSDFRLQSSSPAIGAGVAVGVALAGLARDFDGNIRAAGNPDLGAYTYSIGSQSSLPPSPPPPVPPTPSPSPSGGTGSGSGSGSGNQSGGGQAGPSGASPSGGGSSAGSSGGLSLTPTPAAGNPAASLQAPGFFPPGSLVNDGGTIYFIAAGYFKIPFTSLKAFKGLGYRLKNVIKGDTGNYQLSSSFVLSSPTQEHPWGSWLKFGRTIYYSVQDGFIPVPSMRVFASNGGQLKFVVPMSRIEIKQLKTRLLPKMTANDPRVQR